MFDITNLEKKLDSMDDVNWNLLDRYVLEVIEPTLLTLVEHKVIK